MAKNGGIEMIVREVPFFNKVFINEIAYVIGENEPFTGKLICRYPTDILKEEETYEDGIKNGISKKYYPNGLLKEMAEYKEGKLNGDFSQFYPNGNIEEYI